MRKTIIVLAYARTGSSLMMQTLKILGIPVIGKVERPDLPQDSNPKGYYEDRAILIQGIDSHLLKKKQVSLEGTAVKLALKKMVREERDDQWKTMERLNAGIIIPIRKPIESVISATEAFKKKR